MFSFPEYAIYMEILVDRCSSRCVIFRSFECAKCVQKQNDNHVFLQPLIYLFSRLNSTKMEFEFGFTAPRHNHFI